MIRITGAFCLVVSLLMVTPPSLLSQGIPPPEYQAPGIGPSFPSQSLIASRGQQCFDALAFVFKHDAVKIMRVGPGKIALHLSFDHDMKDLPHALMHVIQFYETVKASGFVTQYEDAHGLGKAHNLMERQAVEASRAFRNRMGAGYKHVCDGGMT